MPTRELKIAEDTPWRVPAGLPDVLRGVWPKICWLALAAQQIEQRRGLTHAECDRAVKDVPATDVCGV